ncbi:MAG: 2,3-bisphosphoglycerate-independent phosphoglycerate mutase [Thermoleophilia bacterium]
MSDSHRFVCLVVLDGYGVAPPGDANAVDLADTPFLDQLFRDCPNTTLDAAGEAVGLPPGQMGNSEVGHLNLGAGRIVFQDLTRINHAIDDGSFFTNVELVDAFRNARELGSSVHLLGLLSDGGVHSDISHIKALVELGKQQGCERLFLHMFLDGRDVSPMSGRGYLQEVIDFVADAGLGEVATVSGRFYAMDRDNRWERVKKAYDALVYGDAPFNADPVDAVRRSYDVGISDEFVFPVVTSGRPESRIRPEDSVIFFNFRPDRARQITRALIHEDFDEFDRGSNPPLPYYVCLTEYDAEFTVPVAFPPEELNNVLAEVLADAGKKQLHIAETEKYAHVTFFFNGGVEKRFPGEVRKLIPSPQDVPTYDLKPEMSAREVTDELLKLLEADEFDFIIVNFANCDMVGHTGDIKAAVAAVEVVDESVSRVVSKVRELNGIALITADHGNAERMIDHNGGPDTAHTSREVPFIITDKSYSLREGGALSDVAVTVLQLLSLEPPAEMTGTSLLVKK